MTKTEFQTPKECRNPNIEQVTTAFHSLIRISRFRVSFVI